MPLPPTPYPVALVEFEGQAVPPSAVRSLTLETNVQYLADSLELALDNAPNYSDFVRKEQPLEVWLGYVQHPLSWHKSELVHVFSGAVDGVLPSWADDTTLTIRARDHTRLLIDSQGDPGWAWANLTDAEVVAKLAQRAGLQADISPAAGLLAVSEQLSLPGYSPYDNPTTAPSAWDIIQRLAIRNGYVAYVTVDKRLYFGPRGGGSGVGKLPLVGGLLGAATADASLGTWTYFDVPHDLLAAGFDDSALVVNTVTVARWMGLDGPGFISGTATDPGRLTAARGRVVAKTVVSVTATDDASCKVEATARLKELARAAITATATVEGDPRLVGDARITLAGLKLGRFRGDYYISAARHRFGTDGYTTGLQLSSVRPEASEVYRPTIDGTALTPDQAAGLQTVTNEQPTAPGCGAAPVDWAAEWPEFLGRENGPVAHLLAANGMPAGAYDAACGPIAAAGLMKAYGITTDPGKLAARAFRGDAQGKWWTGQGQAGPDSLVKLLIASGLNATKLTGSDGRAEAIKRCSACQPVIFNGSGDPGHYLLASAYRADGKFFVGVTGSNALRQGADWMSLQDIANIPAAGAVTAFIVADAPLPMKAGANQATGGPATTDRTRGWFSRAPALVQAAVLAGGWPEDQHDNAAAIVMAESQGDATVVNSIGATGLFQIYVAVWRAEVAAYLGLPDSTSADVITERLKDPVTNSKVARDIVFKAAQQRFGNGWHYWDTAAPLGLA